MITITDIYVSACFVAVLCVTCQYDYDPVVSGGLSTLVSLVFSILLAVMDYRRDCFLHYAGAMRRDLGSSAPPPPSVATIQDPVADEQRESPSRWRGDGRRPLFSVGSGQLRNLFIAFTLTTFSLTCSRLFTSSSKSIVTE